MKLGVERERERERYSGRGGREGRAEKGCFPLIINV